MPSHLNSYPKTFNRWGHLRALPKRQPVYFPFKLMGVITASSIMGYYLIRSLLF